jgi:hypothetical protein
MEVKFSYSDMTERELIVKQAEAQGLAMLHDNFDPDWKPGREPHGTMVFTDVMLPSLPVVDWQGQYNVAAPGDKVKVLAKMLGLQA